MATLSELIAQRDEFIKKLSPEKRITHGDKSVEYHDPVQAKATLELLDREIAKAGGQKSRRITGYVVVSSKGL